MISLSNIRITRAILIVATIPLLATLFFAGEVILEEANKVTELDRLQTLTQLSTKMSHLVHEQQKERGATAGFLNSGGTKFGDTLVAQRKETDAKKEELQDYLRGFNANAHGEVFRETLQNLLADLGKMDAVRKEVSALSITPGAAIGYYTGLNTQNLNIIGSMTLLSGNAEITNHIHSYINFLQSKERAGIERAVGAGSFAKGAFAPGALDKFKTLITIQDTYLKAFLVTATAAQKEFFNTHLTGEAIDEVARMRDVAISSPQDVSSVDAAYWFKTITKKINALKQIEDSLANDLAAKMSATRAQAFEAKVFAIATGGAAALIVILLSWAIIRNTGRSFNDMTHCMKALADGNVSIDIPSVGNTNEMGSMAASVQVFKDNAIERIRSEEAQKKADEKAAQDKIITMNNLADSFEQRVQGIIQMVAAAATQLSNTASTMTDQISQSSMTVQYAADGATQTNNNVQSVASAAEEMSVTTEQISSQMERAGQLVTTSVSVVDEADLQAKKLSEASARVKEVIQLISDIANQINLLALNATIESARAGEAGKGFAVVAGEVKNLASQTDKSIQEIEQVIGEIGEASDGIVTSLSNVKQSVEDIAESSQTVSNAVQEQSSATREIAGSMQSASQGTQEISGSLMEVSKGAAESQASSSEVLSAAQELSQQAELMQREVGEFLSEIRNSGTN